MYYSKNKLLSYNRFISVVVGGRGIGKTYSFKLHALNSPISCILCDYSGNVNYTPDVAINLPLTWVDCAKGNSNDFYDPLPIDNISGDTEVALMYCPDLSQ